MKLLAALTPGLAVFLVTSNALRKGFAAAWRATIGIEIGNAIYIDGISGGFFIAIGFLLGTKSAEA